jgi:hypothetical protein
VAHDAKSFERRSGEKVKGKKSPPPTYKQTLMELSLLARRAGQLAQDENRMNDVVKCSTVILIVDRLLNELAAEKKG